MKFGLILEPTLRELPETNDNQKRPTESASPKINVRRQRELFEQAIGFTTQQEQREFLMAQCRDDPQMAQSVESLLRIYSDDSSHWLNNDLFETAFLATDPEPEPGTRIEGYELKKLLGCGGMGAVWLARQITPVDRDVAIKLIRWDRESSGFLKRFDAERRALAAMNHPNIATILDAGKTDQGQPYFAMELVNGVPLGEYCASQNLTVQDRLRLFVPICRAVEHAHQKGIIHRDLKPSNVLISEVDGNAVPKIIDFGLARALSIDSSNQSNLTQAGVLLGTPDYMAPEQASFGGSNVDIRSDVFALGAILFELLTGLPLHRDQKYIEAEFDEKLRMIRDFEPQRPSVRLAAAGRAHDQIFANLNREQCARVLKRELDWIILKSLDNDRKRRYQSVGELCADVVRYLNSEAVLAHPPSRTYLLGKFLRRHRGVVAAVGSVALVLTIGLAGTTYGLISANRATKVAIEERNNASLASEAATNSAKLEKQQREFSDAIVDFLKTDFLLLTTVDGQLYFDPENEVLGKDATLQDLLKRAGEKLSKRNDLEPVVRAELAWTIGTSHRAQGDYEQAIELLQESFDIRSGYRKQMPNEYLNCANSLSVALSSDENMKQAIEVLELALDHVAESPQVDVEVRNAACRSLAANLRRINQTDRARKILLNVYNNSLKQFGENHRSTIFTLLSLAKCDQVEKKMESANQRYKKVIELSRNLLGASHPTTFSAISGFVNTTKNSSVKRGEAIEILKQAISESEEKLGVHHPRTNSMMTSLGHNFWSDGNYEQAIATFSELAKRNSGHFGESHLFTLRAKSNLALNYRDSGDFKAAIEIFESLLQYDHLQMETMQDVADTYLEASRKDDFLALLDEPLEQAREKLFDNPRDLAQLLWHMSADAMSIREYNIANKLAAESLEIQIGYDPEHYERYFIEFTFASTLFYLGKLDAAKSPIESAYEGLLKNRGKHPIVERRLKEVVGSLIVLAKKTKNTEDMRKWQAVKNDLFESPK